MTLKTRLSCSMKWACRKGDFWNEKDRGVAARHSGAAGTSVTRTLPAPSYLHHLSLSCKSFILFRH